VTIIASTGVAAHFTLIKYTLTVTIDPEDGGIVTGGGTYQAGASVNVIATPDAGWSFTGWSGACSGTSPPYDCIVKYDSGKSVTAHFALIPTPTPVPPTPTPPSGFGPF
jgi:uncharacterized repeat protein (TIGR02543 family)